MGGSRYYSFHATAQRIPNGAKTRILEIRTGHKKAAALLECRGFFIDLGFSGL